MLSRACIIQYKISHGSTTFSASLSQINPFFNGAVLVSCYHHGSLDQKYACLSVRERCVSGYDVYQVRVLPDSAHCSVLVRTQLPWLLPLNRLTRPATSRAPCGYLERVPAFFLSLVLSGSHSQLKYYPVLYVTCTGFQSKTRQMYKILLLHSLPGADY
jgi:hypothetical protein